MSREQQDPTRQNNRRTCVSRRAGRALDRAVKAGASSYDRLRDLPGLIRMEPISEAPETAEAIAAILARLERALRAERCRARGGHWTYDLNRHIALRQAYLAEAERLRAIKSSGE